MTTIASPGTSVPPSGGTMTRRMPRTLVRYLAARPSALVCAAYLAMVAVVSLGAPVFAPYNPGTQDLTHVLSGPTGSHWLGTDELGRDVLSRLMFGGRVALLSVVEAVVVFILLGVTLGLVAGFLGGWVDRLTSRLGDLLLAMPGIIVLLMVLAVFPGNNLATMIAFGVLGCPTLLRVVRASTMAIRTELYVKAARLSGLSSPQIIRRHLLPKLAGPIIVQVSLFSAAAVLVQGALSFLGLSTPDSSGPSWGNMVAEASEVTSRDPWLLIPTGGVLALTVLALGLLGDAVRDSTVGRTTATPTIRRSTAHPARRPARLASVPPEETADTLLSVRGLTIAFRSDDSEIPVVREVNFDIAPGEAVGIVGESGCGKSVTARSLLGLLPSGGRITAGSALFAGGDLANMTEREYGTIRGRGIALIAQEPMSSLDPSFLVGSQLIEVIRRHNPVTRKQAAARANELFSLVNLPEPDRVAHSYPHELSGGMAQRVSIAMALAGNPTLLIADEPTTALDVTVQAEILALLRDLRERLGMAIILITHDWGVLADLCDRALVMYGGEIVEQAALEDIYTAPLHPYTEGLLAANPQRAPIGRPLPAIPGSVPAPSSWPMGCHFEPRCSYATQECTAGLIPLAEPTPGRFTRCIHFDEVGVR